MRSSSPTSASASSGRIGCSEISVTSATFSYAVRLGNEIIELEDEPDMLAPVSRKAAVVEAVSSRSLKNSWPLVA